LRVYRQVNFNKMKSAGFSRSDRYRYWNDTPKKIKKMIDKMEENVKVITKINRVAYQRKKGISEAERAVRKCLAMKEWPLQDIEMYVRTMKSAGPVLWREYSNFKKQHGYIQYSVWQQIKAQEMLFERG